MTRRRRAATPGGRWAPLAAAVVTVAITAGASALASDSSVDDVTARAATAPGVAPATPVPSVDAPSVDVAPGLADRLAGWRERGDRAGRVSAPVITESVPTTTASVDAEPNERDVAPIPDSDNPAVVARPAPPESPPPPPPDAPAPPWAAFTSTTPAGYVATGVGCASGTDGAALDEFFAQRVGPVLGWDYQHVYPLGGNRHLWLFQDTFVDHSGTANSLGRSGFVHNAALLQDGACFTLLYRGSTASPQPFEPGTGTRTLSHWFWPMGGELHDGRLHVFWVRMVKDPVDPTPPDGLGWHPADTWIATYDPATLARVDFRPAPSAGTVPVYGYAVSSDATHTYLFGNTFEQNLLREGGYWNGPHSATRMYLARVPRGQVFATPEYRTVDGWSADPAHAAPILDRHWVEFPMQPRFMDGQWVAVAAIDGYWGDELSVDVARDPWGPWTTVAEGPLLPRNADPLMNTYHAHLAPWRDAAGDLVVTVSNNARNMLAHAWPRPDRYRPMAFSYPWIEAPPRPVPPPTTAPASTTAPSTSAATTTSSPPTTPVPTTTTTTSPTTTTTSTPTTSTSTTSTSTTTTSTSTTTVPDTIPGTVPDTSPATTGEEVADRGEP